MDSPVVAVLALVAFVAVIVGLRWLMGRAGAKLHQTINRSDFNAGKQLYGRSWDWRTNVAWEAIRAAVDRELAPLQAQLPGLQIVADSAAEEHLAFGFNFKGVRVAQGSLHFGGFDGLRRGGPWEFSAGLNIAEAAATGRTVHFEFLSMKTFDGVGRCVTEMRQLLAMIERAVKTADSQATEQSGSAV